MATDYLPVNPDFEELFEQAVSDNRFVSIHYFGQENTVESEKGKLKHLLSNARHEEFVVFENGKQIRLDRIIVFDGKPGPAYDEYDSFALACLDCMGGMD